MTEEELLLKTAFINKISELLSKFKNFQHIKYRLDIENFDFDRYCSIHKVQIFGDKLIVNLREKNEYETLKFIFRYLNVPLKGSFGYIDDIIENKNEKLSFDFTITNFEIILFPENFRTDKSEYYVTLNYSNLLFE